MSQGKTLSVGLHMGTRHPLHVNDVFFYFSGFFEIMFTIVTLIRKSNFFRVCKTLPLDIFMDFVSWKLSHELKLLNAKAAAHLNSWWAISCLIKDFIAKYAFVKQNPRTPLNWHKCGL